MIFIEAAVEANGITFQNTASPSYDLRSSGSGALGLTGTLIGTGNIYANVISNSTISIPSTGNIGFFSNGTDASNDVSSTVNVSGRLRLGTTNALRGSGAISLASGSVLELTGNFATSKNIVLSGAPQIQALSGGELSGVISGASNLVLDQPGNLILSNPANSFSGSVSVNNGRITVANPAALGPDVFGKTLQLQDGELIIPETMTFGQRAFNTTGSVATINVAATRELTLPDFRGAAVLTKSGDGTLVLPNDGRSFSRNFFIDDGLVRVGANFALGAVNGATVRVAGGATIELNSGLNYLNARPTTLGNSALVPATLRSLGGTGRYSAAITTNGIGLIDVISGALTLPGLLASTAATNTLQKTGPGELILENTGNTFAGSIQVLGGVLTVPSVNNGGVSGPLGTAASTTLNGGTLRFVDASQTSNRTLTIGASGGTVDIFNSGSNLTLTSGISGANPFTKIGPGTLTLTGNNSTATAISVNAGILAVSNVNNAATSGPLGTATSTTLNGGTLRFTGSSQITTRALTIGSSGGTVDTLSGSLTFGGALTGTGPLTKAGTGSLAFTSAANTLTGNITINQGSLTLHSLANGGTVSGAGSLTKAGTGTATVAHVRTNSLTVSDGTLTISSNGTDTGTSRVQSLTFDTTPPATPVLNLINNDLIVTGTTSAPPSIAAIINFWNTNLLTANAQQGGLPTYLAITTAADIGATDFSGQAVNPTDVLVKFTYVGDANLDGQVDALDYERVDLHIGNTGVFGTALGDLNYDSIVDALDYERVDLNIGNGVGSPLLLSGEGASSTGGLFSRQFFQQFRPDSYYTARDQWLAANPGWDHIPSLAEQDPEFWARYLAEVAASTTPPPTNPGAIFIPEPTTLALAATATSLLLRRRK